MHTSRVETESYKIHLSGSLSRSMIDEVAFTVYDDVSNFDRVFELIFDKDEKVAWRAAWACEKIIQKFPEFVDNQKLEQITSLTLNTKHDGIRRITLSILFSIPITKQLNVELINSCFDWMISTKQPIAVQALSLKLLSKYSKYEPELIPEFLAYLENFDSDQLSPAMISCKRNALKELNRKK